MRKILIILIVFFSLTYLVLLLGQETIQKFLSKPQIQKSSINTQTNPNSLACPVPEEYCHTYIAKRAQKDSGDFLIFPSNIPTDTSLYAVWDGELQPASAGKDGQTTNSITITKDDGIKAVYLFKGMIKNKSNLPYKVKRGEKIAQLQSIIPSAFSKDQSMLILNFQKNIQAATSSGQLKTVILETKDMVFE